MGGEIFRKSGFNLPVLLRPGGIKVVKTYFTTICIFVLIC